MSAYFSLMGNVRIQCDGCGELLPAEKNESWLATASRFVKSGWREVRAPDQSNSSNSSNSSKHVCPKCVAVCAVCGLEGLHTLCDHCHERGWDWCENCKVPVKPGEGISLDEQDAAVWCRSCADKAESLWEAEQENFHEEKKLDNA